MINCLNYSNFLTDNKKNAYRQTKIQEKDTFEKYREFSIFKSEIGTYVSTRSNSLSERPLKVENQSIILTTYLDSQKLNIRKKTQYYGKINIIAPLRV